MAAQKTLFLFSVVLIICLFSTADGFRPSSVERGPVVPHSHALSSPRLAGTSLSSSSAYVQEFYAELSRPLPDGRKIDSFIDSLISSSTKSKTNVNTNILTKTSNLGTWKIVWAPHINTLQKILFTNFEVSYVFSEKIEDRLTSNVVYTSPVFGRGHLNTEGVVSINTDYSECSIVWDKIWWDMQPSPTCSTNISNHILPSMVQTLGKAAFIEGVSKFPIQYLDTNTCVFLFTLFGTRICAQRQSQGTSYIDNDDLGMFNPSTGDLELGPWLQSKLGRKGTAALAAVLLSPYLLFAIRGIKEARIL